MTNTYRLLSLVAVVAVASILLTSTFLTSPIDTTEQKTTLTNERVRPDAEYLAKMEQEMEQLRLDKEVADVIRHSGGLALFVSGATALTEEEAMALAEEGREIKEFTLIGRSVDLPIMGGTPEEPAMYKAMTFNEQVPGPTIRVKQGDIIKLTLTVPSDEPVAHGRSIHIAQGSVVPSILAVMPGESRTSYFIAEYPGTWKYHCTGVNVADMDRHVLSGMYGMVIVDPVDGYKPLIVRYTEVVDGEVQETIKRYSAEAYELQFQFNHLYLDENGNYDFTKMVNNDKTQAVMNGMAFGYMPNDTIDQAINGDANKDILPIQPWQSFEGQYRSQVVYVPTNEHIRIFVENHGNDVVFLHFIGEIFDRVTMGNRIQAEGVESWGVPGSTGAILELVFEQPGVYVFANHDYSSTMTGHVAIFVAGNFFKEQLRDDLGDAVDEINYYAEVLGNPSDAIPPPGEQTIPWPKYNIHGLYTDERAAEIATEIEQWYPDIEQA
ncbi:MAG: hypothetical protein KatS3mg003_1097 [Candidatus Nitrosocaldaceae archaeon]|nr:MAG: hypothetical protein KatS3mg003_1097 [Candidatus Nitrosocaldaceae archaeon]